jgi:hypothetical protein
MCNKRTLHQNKVGQVVYCEKCNNYTITIGNLVTNVAEDELRSINGIFSRINVERHRAINPDKRVLIRTPLTNVMFSYSLKEIEQAQELLALTLLMASANSIMGQN